MLELSIFLQSRLFDDKFHTVITSKADEDASLPQNIPDIEIMPVSRERVSVPTPALKPFVQIAWRDTAAQADNDGGLGFLCLPLRPKSTGTVRLASSDPFDEPVVDLNYLSSESDIVLLRSAIRFTRQLKEEILARGYRLVDYIVPSSDADADIDAFIRRACQTTYHYSSTCRMAPEGGVLDDRLRVHGVRGLRVADSSAFPRILSTHLAAPTVALAEKCADMIKEDNRGRREDGGST